MGLVDEPGLDGHVGQRLPAQDQVSSGVEPAADQVSMGRDPERGRERAGQDGRALTDIADRAGERDRFEQVLVEMRPETLGDAVDLDPPLVVAHRVAERRPDPLGDEREPCLGVEQVVAAAKPIVQGRDLAAQTGDPEVRSVDGAPDQPFGEHAAVDIQHSLAIAVRRRGPAVVRDVGRQHPDHRLVRSAWLSVQVVADPARVDDEERPGVVGVERVRVVGEPGMEDLPDPRDERLPGLELEPVGERVHRRIVQDRSVTTAYGRAMEQLITLVGFSFVSSVTPGPNNVLLWGSGATFGFRRSLPHVLGTSLGIGAMAVAVAAGLGALLTTVPEITVAMKVGGSIYLLYLAYQIAGASAIQPGSVARPLGLVQAAAFQVINPKAWVFAVGAITTFRPVGLPLLTGGLLVALTMMAVVVPTAAIWAGGGRLLGPLMASERAHRITSLVLAALLAGTVVFVWI